MLTAQQEEVFGNMSDEMLDDVFRIALVIMNLDLIDFISGNLIHRIKTETKELIEKLTSIEDGPKMCDKSDLLTELQITLMEQANADMLCDMLNAAVTLFRFDVADYIADNLFSTLPPIMRGCLVKAGAVQADVQ